MNEKIHNLAYKNPIVRQCLDWHRYGKGVSYTEALEEMVIHLVENNDALSAQLVEYLSKSEVRSF